MSKIALLGDTHWGNKNDSPVFYTYFEKYYPWLFEQLESREITNLIQLGDLFDRRKYINFKTLSEAKRVFLNPLNKGYNSTILAGNHDVTYKNTNEINSVGLLLREYSNIRTIECDPHTVYICNTPIDFYPWICPDNFQQCMDFAAKSQSQVAVGHFEFSDFEMYKGHLADHGMDAKLFDRYKWVFSGHYHTHSHRENVVYAGSPYELNWSDWGDQKGFIILDTDNLTWEFVKSPFTLFEKVYYDDKNSKFSDLKKLDLHGKYVKIIVQNKTDFYKWDKFVDAVVKSGASDVKIVEESVSAAIDAMGGEEIQFDDTPTLMKAYIDTLQEINIDKTRLKSLLQALYIEATSITQ